MLRLSICTSNHRFPCYCVQAVIMRILSQSRGWDAPEIALLSVTAYAAFLVFILHTRCLFTFSLNRAKRWSFTGPERMIREVPLFFGSHDDPLILVFWHRSWFLHSTFHRNRRRKCSQVCCLITLFNRFCYPVVFLINSRRYFSHRLKKRGNQTNFIIPRHGS